LTGILRLVIDIEDLKAHTDEYVRRAAHGEVIVIADDGVAVAELSPRPTASTASGRDELIRRGVLIPASRPFVPSVGAAKMRPGFSLSDVVIEERQADRLLGE